MDEEVKTMGRKVARVLDIDGKRLMYTRKFPSGNVGTFQAYPGMKIYLNDHLKTGENTTAIIEFDIGGRATINPDVEIEVVGTRDIDMVSNKFVNKAGRIWAKVDKQKSQLQISTSGGTLGVEG